MNDAELLREYARDGLEAAFRVLVERHVALVYSAALRQVGERALAEDITQVVFVILARKAARLPERVVLTGWLYRTTRHTATRALRGEQRRRRREREAVEMQATNDAEAIWGEMAPWLDTAMAQLSETERSAVLLRYFQNRSLRDVGQALGLSEDTAQKRVARAIEKLRRLLYRRRVAVSSVALTGLLSTHAAQLVPPYLGTAVATAALSKAALPATVGSLLYHALKQPFWPKAAMGASAAFGVLALAVGLVYLWPKAQREAGSFTLDSRIVTHTRPVAKVQIPPIQPPSPATDTAVAAAPVPSPTISQPPPVAKVKVPLPPPPPSWPTNIPRFTLPVFEVGKLPDYGSVNPVSTDQPPQVDVSSGSSSYSMDYPIYLNPRVNIVPLANPIYFMTITNRFSQPMFNYPTLPSRTIVKPAPSKKQVGPGKSAFNLQCPLPPNGAPLPGQRLA
jgi:RNA polymerase sigma factor (sigma-70 family)